MKRCIKCGAPIAEGQTHCGVCGSPVINEDKVKIPKAPIIIGIVLAILVIAGVATYILYSRGIIFGGRSDDSSTNVSQTEPVPTTTTTAADDTVDPKDVKKTYTVLVVESAIAENYYDANGNVVFTADSIVNYVKSATPSFFSSLASDGKYEKDYIAIVQYQNSAQVVSEFSADPSQLTNKLNALYASGNSNMSEGLQKAKELLDSIDEVNAEKNVVLVMARCADTGQYSQAGKYDSSVVGSYWTNNNNDNIPIYYYANYAYSTASSIKPSVNLYVINMSGIFDGIPQEESSIAQLYSLAAVDLASSSSTYFAVNKPDNLQGNLARVAEAIKAD